MGKEVLESWLSDIGLELKPSKTRITHTLQEYQGVVGFDFLGWTVRQFPVGKTHTGKAGYYGPPLGFKTLIRPSKEAVKRHLAEVGHVIHIHRNRTQGQLIRKLKKNSATNTPFIGIATMKDTPDVLTVPLTKARSLRSRVTGNCHARF